MTAQQLAVLEDFARKFLRTALNATVLTASQEASRRRPNDPVDPAEIRALVRRALDVERARFSSWDGTPDLQQLELGQRYRWSAPTGLIPGLEEASS
jgi:hypothetical protein